MTHEERNSHLFAPGPKRILALDGGGIRGMLSLQFLARLEEMVRDRSGRRDATLSDYFDLIGGTSTGAIIATGLALGWEVSQLSQMYQVFGGAVFDSKFFRRGLFRPKFSEKVLEQQLEANFGDATLGGTELKTGLAVVMKRLDTGSPWVVHNNPRGKYYEARPGSTATPNKDFLLRDVVRASTAAPTYFKPEPLTVGAGQVGAFVDGGVSPHNNPALQLLMLATVRGYGLQWPTGPEQLLLVSVGTGGFETAMDAEKAVKAVAVANGIQSLSALMDDAASLNETLLQWMSRSDTARQIDREIGSLENDFLGGAPLLTYQRYQAWLEKDWLKRELGMELSVKELDALGKMDKPENLDRLAEVGQAAAARLVESRHLPAVFDIA
ncbi:MAG: patatin-like phospholipase family protein [Pseudomonadota bacterium]